MGVLSAASGADARGVHAYGTANEGGHHQGVSRHWEDGGRFSFVHVPRRAFFKRTGICVGYVRWLLGVSLRVLSSWRPRRGG